MRAIDENLASSDFLRFSFRLIREQSFNEPFRELAPIYSPSFAFHATAVVFGINERARLARKPSIVQLTAAFARDHGGTNFREGAVSEAFYRRPGSCVREREPTLLEHRKRVHISPSCPHLVEFKCGINWDACEDGSSSEMPRSHLIFYTRRSHNQLGAK